MSLRRTRSSKRLSSNSFPVSTNHPVLFHQELSLSVSSPSSEIMTTVSSSSTHHSLRLPNRALFMDDQDSSSSLTGSTITVVWYCVVAVVTLSIGIFCACLRRRQRRRERDAAAAANHHPFDDDDANLDTTQEESELARMEANVKVFAEKQKSVQKKHLMQAMNGQFVTVTTHDLEHMVHLSDGCAICRESFTVGDRVAQNTVEACCRHMFHQECILSWFVSSGLAEQRCPCCRQSFLASPADGSSTNNNDDVPAQQEERTTPIVLPDEEPLASSAVDDDLTGSVSSNEGTDSASDEEEMDKSKNDNDDEDSPVIIDT